MKETAKKMQEYLDLIELQRREMKKRIIGLDELVDHLFICVYSHALGGLIPNILVEGGVGEGKTVTLQTFAATVSGVTFSKIECTPDMMPGELVETRFQREDRSLEIRRGPIFANFVFANEINRTTEKTTASILGAMAEGRVALRGEIVQLEEPFFLMADENPLETEGVYRLGAAKLDRFMMKTYTRPLNEEERIRGLDSHQEGFPPTQQVIKKEDILDIREFIRNNIFLSETLKRVIVKLVMSLCPEGEIVSPDDFISLFHSNRPVSYFARGAITRAFLRGRTYITLEDIDALVFPIFNHRIIAPFGGDVRDLISRALQKVIEDEARH